MSNNDIKKRRNKKYISIQYKVSPSFRSSVNKLSYSQLVRTVALVNAEKPAEIFEARRITRSILPVEKEVINKITSSKSQMQKKARIEYLQRELSKKNADETENVNTDVLVSTMMRSLTNK